MLRKTIICPTKVKEKWYLSVFIVPIVSIVFFLRILENRYLVLGLKLGISSYVSVSTISFHRSSGSLSSTCWFLILTHTSRLFLFYQLRTSSREQTKYTTLLPLSCKYCFKYLDNVSAFFPFFLSSFGSFLFLYLFCSFLPHLSSLSSYFPIFLFLSILNVLESLSYNPRYHDFWFFWLSASLFCHHSL